MFSQSKQTKRELKAVVQQHFRIDFWVGICVSKLIEMINNIVLDKSVQFTVDSKQYLHFLMALSEGHPNYFLLSLPLSLYRSLLMLKTIPAISLSSGILLVFSFWFIMENGRRKRKIHLNKVKVFSIPRVFYWIASHINSILFKFFQYSEMKKVKYIKKSLVC